MAQHYFTVDLAKAILYAKSMGLIICLREVKRTKQQAEWNAQNGVGSATSPHLDSRAADFYIYDINGKPLEDKAIYAKVGNYFKSLNPKNRWGGDDWCVDQNGHPRNDIYHIERQLD
jgi:hypothetical protein